MADETPEEREALENLDEETRKVAWDEEDREIARERASWGGGPLVPFWLRRWLPWRRDALHEDGSAK